MRLLMVLLIIFLFLSTLTLFARHALIVLPIAMGIAYLYWNHDSRKDADD